MIKSGLFFLLIFYFFGRVMGDPTGDTLINYTEKENPYYTNLENHFTYKIYTSYNFAAFDIRNDSLNKSLKFDIDQPQLLGIGASYKWLGFSVAYGFQFMNKTLGQTKRPTFWDIQTQFNLRKLTLTIYGNSYKGYYLKNAYNQIANWDSTQVYFRPDIMVRTYGMNFIFLNNSDKYSNKATFTQTEWQKKSAGTIVFGGNIFQYTIHADSNMIPINIKKIEYFGGEKLTSFKNLSYGGEAGYAFTLVFFKHIFINAMVLVGVNFSNIEMAPVKLPEKASFQIDPVLISNFGLGFNSRQFYMGFASSSYIINAQSQIANSSINFQTGMYQLVAAFRFKPHRDYLDPYVEKLKNKWEQF